MISLARFLIRMSLWICLAATVLHIFSTVLYALTPPGLGECAGKYQARNTIEDIQDYYSTMRNSNRTNGPIIASHIPFTTKVPVAILFIRDCRERLAEVYQDEKSAQSDGIVGQLQKDTLFGIKQLDGIEKELDGLAKNISALAEVLVFDSKLSGMILPNYNLSTLDRYRCRQKHQDMITAIMQPRWHGVFGQFRDSQDPTFCTHAVNSRIDHLMLKFGRRKYGSKKEDGWWVRLHLQQSLSHVWQECENDLRMAWDCSRSLDRSLENLQALRDSTNSHDRSSLVMLELVSLAFDRAIAVLYAEG